MFEETRPFDSMITIDVGSINTRASFFDLVNGQYRLIASGVAPSTHEFPSYNILEGMRLAIENLQNITGRILLDQRKRLIIPGKSELEGVDVVVATISAGPPLKILAIGLLDDISLESIKHLALSSYSSVMDSVGLGEKRKTNEQLDKVFRLSPDLVIVAGGTDGGATNIVLDQLEPLGIASLLMPEGKKPEVLYVGNQSIRLEVEARIAKLLTVHFAPNIRPTIEKENLDPAQVELNRIYCQIKMRQMKGVVELDNLVGNELLTTSAAFGRTIRFLSNTQKSQKCALGVDVGSSRTTIAAARSGELALGVFPRLATGKSNGKKLNTIELSEIMQWISYDLPASNVLEYIFNKSLFPGSIPITNEEMVIEHALARQAILSSLNSAMSNFPRHIFPLYAGHNPWFEPVIASGSVLAQAPSLEQALLIILDGVQPIGISTIVLDQNQVIAGLGAAAELNPILTIQLMESNVLTHLGTVISPVGYADYATPILRLKMVYDDGREISLETHHGSIDVLPLPIGQSAKIHLTPFYKYDVGMGGPGRSGSIRVQGGVFGLVIDGRGRPLKLPGDFSLRKDLYTNWHWSLSNR